MGPWPGASDPRPSVRSDRLGRPPNHQNRAFSLPSSGLSDGDSMELNENLGTRIMLERERVRIWEHRVSPGETGPLHLHRRPYFSVVVNGSSGETVDPDGKVLEHFALRPGRVLWYGEEHLPETHALRNTGSGEVLIVTTEIL